MFRNKIPEPCWIPEEPYQEVWNRTIGAGCGCERGFTSRRVAAASIQLRQSRQLSGTLIVACRSTSSQPSDDFNKLLLLLEIMIDFVTLRGLPSAHFGKELHRASLLGSSILQLFAS
jgi:hypothetical protein